MRILPGHYLEASWADDLLSRCACVAVAEPRAVVSHRTALQLRGVPVPTSERGRVHVVVPQSGVRPRWRGVVVHRSHRRTPPTVSGGVSVTGVARAWCGSAALVRPASPLAAVTGPDLADLVAALDVLAARSDGALGAVRRELAATSGGRGAALARSAIALHDPRAESAQESRLRVVLTLAGLPPEAVQHEVRTQQGRFVARVDLAWPSRKVALEYDGDHHRSRTQWRRDLERRRRLESLGWRVVEVTAADLLGHPERVVGWVREALRRRVA